MAFKPEEHLRPLKGQQYLDCVWRVVWLREEHPDAQIDTEIVWWDHDKQEILVRAVVVLPQTGARATGHCVGSERDFKFGYVEKAETQAVGRALALLGYGTAFAAADLEEAERPADSPQSGQATQKRTQAAGPAEQSQRAGPTVVAAAHKTMSTPVSVSRAPQPQGDAASWTQKELADQIRTLARSEVKTLAQWQALTRQHAGIAAPRSASEMTPQWLLSLYQALRAQDLGEALEEAPDEEAVASVMNEAVDRRERHEITMEQWGALCAAEETKTTKQDEGR